MLTTLLALHCLALNVYHEARGEPFTGQIAVAQVTMRRANKDPAQACDAVYAKGQFSWTATPASKRMPDPADPAWLRAYDAAAMSLRWAAGEKVKDYSAGATHYHAAHVEPYWASRFAPTTTIGAHVFRRKQ